MVVSASTRLLDSLAQRSVPGWLTARDIAVPTITQGVLCWQATPEELSVAMKQCTSDRAAPPTVLKLWLGSGADSLCCNSWYGVGQVKVVARSRRGTAAANPCQAPPGTVLDISSSGVTVSVLKGAVRLSNFLTPLGRPLTAAQLPLAVGQRLPKLTLFQQRAIAQLSNTLAPHESTWHRRLSQLSPLPLPHASGEPGLGSIFGRAPLLGLEAALAQGNAEFQGYLAEFGGVVLLTALAGYLWELSQAQNQTRTGDQANRTADGGKEQQQTEIPLGKVSLGDIGLRSNALQQRLRSEELAALFASHVPARFSLDLRAALGSNLETILQELRFLAEAITHRQDLALGTNPTQFPSLYGVLVELVTEVAEQPNRLGQALTIQLAEGGEACVWFYNPAVLSEEEVDWMQAAFLARLAAIARAPQGAFGDYFAGSSAKALRLC